MARTGLAVVLAAGIVLVGCGDGAGQAPADNRSADGQEERAEGRSPSAIYQEFCVNCHATGMAGAPRVGPDHRRFWAEEVEEEGVPHLVKVAIEGRNGMPPKGTCFDCTDRELEATVLHMLKKSDAR